MRASILTAAAAGVALFAVSSAGASVITVGSNYAASCYRAAEARSTDRSAWEACNEALAVGALSERERAGTLVNRGILHLVAGRPQAALTDFAAAERIDPLQPEVYLNQALIAYRADDKRRARDLATRSLDLGTRKPAFALYLRGVVNEDLGAIRAAYADLRRAAELAPGWAEPKRELVRYRTR